MVVDFLLRNLNIISIVAFYAIIISLIYKNRKKIETVYKVIFLFRTKKGLKTINFLGQFKRFWKAFGYSSIVIGFVGMVFILGSLVKTLFDSITSPHAPAGVSIIIPGVNLPFWYGIISLVLLVLVHEGAHGIVARAHGIKVKNTGVGMFLFLPLAFVEPAEKDLRKRPAKVQLSVFAAGSMANFCLAGLALLLGTMVVFPAAAGVAQFNGLEITELLEGFPAESSGIESGDLITAINGNTLESTQTLVDELEKVSPGEEITLGNSEGEIFSVITAENPDNPTKPYIGISFAQDFSLKPQLEAKYWKFPWLIVHFSQLLMWLFFLNLGIGLFNLMPIAIVDGGRMAHIGIHKIFKKPAVANRLFVYVSLFALSLLLLNLFSPLLF